MISIHALLAESDRLGVYKRHYLAISIHALLAESDNRGHHSRCGSFDFYPRSPCGERPYTRNPCLRLKKFLSTLSLRRATFQTPNLARYSVLFLSTLSLRRATKLLTKRLCNALFLSTLSLRRATVQVVIIVVHALFLSTLSLRRATIISPHSTPDNGNFYPRSPCGERLQGGENGSSVSMISIHALLAESDAQTDIPQKRPDISIHALLAESDPASIASGLYTPDFYPRSPCGERLLTYCFLYSSVRFLSTLSLRRATAALFRLSAHRPEFLSTLSLRRATLRQHLGHQPYGISIHALLAESDRRWCRAAPSRSQISIHALLAESDADDVGGAKVVVEFLSTLSLRRATFLLPSGASG